MREEYFLINRMRSTHAMIVCGLLSVDKESIFNKLTARCKQKPKFLHW